jgi:hypothetical protein
MNLAQQAMAQAPRPVWDARLFWLSVTLVAVILIGALVIYWIDRWRKRSDGERLSANDQLAQFRELYDQGQLSQEEFERIRASLAPQLRREWDAPAAGGSPSEAKPQPTQHTEEPPT